MRLVKIVIVAVFCAAASACGGGGPGPQPAAGPPPAPQPPPPPPNPNNTAEFRANTALNTIGALTAYDQGLDGSGVIVAFFQLVDFDHPEFAGRIISDPTFPAIKAENDGHGTQVLGIIGAARDGVEMHGVAPNVDLLLAGVGSPTAHQSAVDGGAKVINISSSSDGPTVRGVGQRSLEISAPAGIVTVYSASNQSAPDPRTSQLAAIDPEADGTAMIVGSVDANNVISSFSNRAGIAKEVYLVAPGEGLRTTTLDGGYTTVSGTSFASPQVSGAAALLFQMWPNLTAQEVVQILLTTATDLGDPGVDVIYGHGLLNLDEALSPQGSTSIPGIGIEPVSVDQTSIAFSSAFGDAGSAAFQDVLVFDGWDRAFVSDFSGRISRTGGARFDAAAIFRARRLQASGSVRASETVTARVSYLESERIEYGDPLGLSDRGLADEGDLRLQMHWQVSDTTMIEAGRGISIAEAFDTPGTRLVTGGRAVPYLTEATDSVFASVQHALLGGWKLRAVVAQGAAETFSRALPALAEPTSQTLAYGEIGRASRNVEANIRFGMVEEKDAILGARSTGAFRLADGSTTRFLGLSAQWQMSQDFGAFAEMTYGWTHARLSNSSLFNGMRGVRSSAWQAGIRGAFREARFTLGVSQPLRIESGSASLRVPVGRDYVENAILYESRTIGLAPSAREIDLEASVQLSVLGGYVEANLIWQLNAYHQPGNAGLVLLRHATVF